MGMQEVERKMEFFLEVQVNEDEQKRTGSKEEVVEENSFKEVQN